MNKLFEAVHGKNRDKKGFTVAELLFVVAILVILFGLVALSLVKMQKELRQKELDSKAEIIYSAAQNRITELKAQGLKAKYETGGTELGFIPYDADKTVAQEYIDFFYTSSAEKTDENEPAYWVLPETSVDSELYSGNWIIEYNVKSGSVYSVFYSESQITKTAKELDYLRSKNARLDDGARIGYYGGEIIIVEQTREFVIRRLNIVNEETLYADITVFNPVSSDFKLTYWLEDSEGHKTAEKEISAKTFVGGGEYTAKLNLDSLINDASRFGKLFPELTAGDDFTLHVSAGIPSNSLIKKGSREETANSLFANREGDYIATDTAYIKYGRHLQNLDEASGTGVKITKAVQLNDIFFAENGEKENEGKLWLDVYGTKKLTAIYNEKLLSYTGTVSEKGTVPTIYGANIAAGKNACSGIFAAAADGMEIKNLCLSGTTVTAGKYSGALIGESTGKVKIENCSVILSGEKGDLDGKTKTEAALLESRISGTEGAGGLVGIARSTGNGGLTIIKSFAATIVKTGASGISGGLVGKAEGTLTVSESYASCYVSGNIAGGIAGTAGSLVINDSYAAGYLTATGTIYGLSGGALSGSSANTYTAVHSTTAKPFYSTCASGSANKVYYLEESSTESYNLINTERKSFGEMGDRATFAALLGNKFTATTGGDSTSPYNLLNQGLTDYSFPKLAAIQTHYGDWNAEFVTAQLVYFEEYPNGSFGFSGANKDTLREAGPSTVAVGDGYALVFDSATKPSAGDGFRFKLQLSQDGTMSREYVIDAAEADFKEVEENGEVTYYLLPIKSGSFDASNAEYSVNNSETASAFYRKIEITGGTENNTETYYFNPHFAKTVTSDLPAKPPTTVYVRSPRQLYLMSEEYPSYAEFLDSASVYTTFRQETALYYEEYKWTEYYSYADGEITSQQPIGDAQTPFLSIYDGSCYGISGVSFAGRGNYIGMFGINEGRLVDVVLTKHNIASGEAALTIKRTGTIIYSGTNVFMGVLCGQNRGTISNCAAANYAAVVDVNQGASLALGGLCGDNRGTIVNSSAVISGFEVSALYSEIYAGGFVGENSGTIRYCYSLGSIRVKSADSTRTVRIAGFAALNSGDVNYCYCATALTTSGSASSSAFTPANEGTTAKNSFFVNDGTYYFGNDLYSYKSTEDYGVIGPQGVSAAELKTKNISRYFGKTNRNTYDEYGSFYGTSKEYPFPAIVRDSAGGYIHYGDWVVEANLGEEGVFYWEYEEGSGSNSGYHLSFIGINGSDSGTVISGSTLCKEHDDGGTVTSYGYGYYYKGATAPVFSIDGVRDISYTRSSAAEAGLHTILSEFNFVAYTSGTPESGTNNLYIEDEQQNSTWYLTPQGANAVTHAFKVCPFFADAIYYESSGGDRLYEDENTAASTDNYLSEPGSENNPYQVRSTKQLQYINWNNVTKSVSTDVRSSNYDDFTYLQYATVTGTGVQTAAAAERARKVQYWSQTHDVDGDNEMFYPIAGTYVTSTGTTAYNAYLYAWFGGQYNGESYIIKNIQISSNLCNVGLFGTTVAARLENIILYSDRDSVIERSSSVSDPAGAYVLGGLVGIAYDYNARTNREITNCAIAGYRIIDNSRNAQRLSEANVGGLAGISNVNLNKCSSVVDIEINCTHRTNDNGTGGYTYAEYGNFVRVGGVAGACRSTMTDCYSGGSVKIGEATLKESVSGGRATTGSFVIAESTHIFIGGLGGSGFCSNFVNFTGSNSLIEGYPSYTNCYTYMTFPKLEGTIRAISLIGSVADRYKYSSATVTNCYYLDMCANIDIDMDSNLYSNEAGWSNTLPRLLNTSDAVTRMLIGNMSCVEMNLKGTSTATTIYTNGLTPVSYDQMSERTAELIGADLIRKQNPTDGTTYGSFKTALGSSFDWVTVEENGASVNGKYSFAGSDLALAGKNYPFPTVIKQRSLIDGKTVNVHYGAWSKVGLFWSESMNYIDIFRDYDYDAKETAKELTLSFEGLNVEGAAAADFRFELYLDNENYLAGTPDIITENAPVEIDAAKDENSDGIFEVVFRARNAGACYVRAIYEKNGTIYTADCYVSVSADFSVTAEPSFAGIYIGDKQSIELSVTAAGANDTVVNLAEKEGLVSWEDVINSKPESNIIYYDKAKPELAESGDKYGFGFDGVGEGELQLTFRAKVTLPLGGTTKEFTKDAYVSVAVKKPGAFGIASEQSETEIKYYEALIPKGETSGGETYLSAATDYTGKVAPALVNEGIYLYASGTGINIDEFTVTKLEVLRDGAATVVFNAGAMDYSKYYVSVEGAKVAEDGDTTFDYRKVKVNAAEGFGGAAEIRVTAEYLGNTYILTAPYNIPAAKPKAILVDSAGNKLLEKEVAFGTAPVLSTEDWDAADLAANVAGIDLGYHCDRAAGTDPALAAIYVDTSYKVTLVPNSYTISFLRGAEGVTGEMAKVTAEYGSSLNLPANAFERLGYKFLKWRLGESTYLNGDSVLSLTAENGGTVALTAEWQAVPDYSIAYDLNGGTGTVPAEVSGIKYGQSVNLNSGAGIAKTGHTFLGWNRSNTAAQALASPVKNLTEAGGSVTLYAVWEKNSYNVTCVYGNGAANSTESRKFGDTFSLSTPERTGYTFAGWNDGTNTYAAGESFTVPAKNVTLTAQWTINKYTVSYSDPQNVYNGIAAEQPRDYNTSFNLPSQTRSGYNLLWSDGTKTYAAGSSYTVPAADVTLTAAWEEIRYTVTFNVNGGVAVASIEVGKNENITLPVTTKSRNMLAGWTLNGTTYKPGATFSTSENVNLTAKWAMAYTVSNNNTTQRDVSYNSATDTYTITLTTSNSQRSYYVYEGTSYEDSNYIGRISVNRTYQISGSAISDNLYFVRSY